MARVEKILEQMRDSPSSVRFLDLAKVCEHYFGEPRQQGTSHRVYRMPWRGDPRVNIQDSHGKAKPYQVRQVLAAIKKLEGESS
ncbi:toxin HicA [Microbacterium sp. YY-01]|uniref:toxin HicA n=1 Tax=Microbacterium sp. YY-01 TaxID=3421634 RepID=UPI003D164DFA